MPTRRGALLRWQHCGWCQPTTRGWRRWVQRLGVRWTTGVCDRCALPLYIQLVKKASRRVQALEARVQRLEAAACAS